MSSNKKTFKGNVSSRNLLHWFIYNVMICTMLYTQNNEYTGKYSQICNYFNIETVEIVGRFLRNK